MTTRKEILQQSPIYFEQEWEAWFVEKNKIFTDPYGWLSLTAIHWLDDGQTQEIEQFPGSWLPVGHTITYYPSNSKPVTNRGKLVTSPVSIQVDEPGDFSLENFDYRGIRAELIKREGSLFPFAVRIRDPHAPTREQFAGIFHYPVEQSWVVPARFEPAAELTEVRVKADLRPYSSENKLGILHIELQGQTYPLTVLQEHNDDTGMRIVGPSQGKTKYLSNRAETEHVGVIRFRDKTSGLETYEGGRRIRIDVSSPEDVNYIDFNRAANPACAYNVYCTCPFAPSENYIPIEITAGEKKPHVSPL